MVRDGSSGSSSVLFRMFAFRTSEAKIGAIIMNGLLLLYLTLGNGFLVVAFNLITDPYI